MNLLAISNQALAKVDNIQYSNNIKCKYDGYLVDVWIYISGFCVLRQPPRMEIPGTKKGLERAINIRSRVEIYYM